MNIAEFSIQKKVITLVFAVVVLFVGLKSYGHLSRLEDPEFTIKQAVIATPYPGATAREVEEEVSNVIEKAVQEMGQLDYVESTSKRDLSLVKVFIKDGYTNDTLPQVWDELRRKIQNYQMQLPPGAGPSIVNDDFGDVYGVYFALTGEGYSYAEMKDVADMLKRELLLQPDVKKVTFYGNQPEVVYIEMNREKMSQLGISQQNIYDSLKAKNLPADAGKITMGAEFIPVNPTGEFKSEQEFGELLISAPGSQTLIYLKDVAKIKRGYQEPANYILRYDGKPAIGIGISTIVGGNAVILGNAVENRIKELAPRIPLGMELKIINLQSRDVVKAVNSFIVNLIEAIIIVVVVLLFSMGLRSGLIIGAILLLTICGTFIFMDAWHVTLERISLGALIIALGMLVDNAIVVTDGMKVRMEKGEDALSAAKAIVGQTGIPLLGATVVAVTAFAAIGTSQDGTGEYCRTLFQVILISLMLSWVTAVTMTPLFCKMFLMGKKKKDSKKSSEPVDPYAGKIFQLYKKGLIFCLNKRWLSVAVVVGLFVVAQIGFKFVDKSFFPNSTRPQYYVNFWLPEGSSIGQTQEVLAKAEEYLLAREEVTHVTSIIGGSEVRFLLVYPVEMPSVAYGQILVDVDHFKSIDKNSLEVQNELEALLPDVTVNLKKYILGPGDGGKIQIRISGPDPDVVRELSVKAKNILYDDGGAKGIKDNWREKVKVVRPQVAEAQARRLGITRPDIATAIKAGFIGEKAGVYREDNELLDIIARAPASERLNVDQINNLEIWSPAESQMVPLRQLVTGFKTEYEDANIWRRDRKTTMTIHADPRTELPSVLLNRIKPKVEKALNVDLARVLGKTFKAGEDPFKNADAKTVPVYYKNENPLKGMPGYTMGWDGEAEDSAKANAALGASIPMLLGLMVLIVICLFNAIKQPLIIWLTVPLAIIGVTVGLLLFGQPFGFMSLLGAMSLSGMLIKNAIVLIDEINCQIESGKDRFDAVVDSGVSRLNPVCMAAATTILGMAPLLQDAFFIAMAVTVMFGLLFATFLTLLFVPVLYVIFFKIHPAPVAAEN